MILTAWLELRLEGQKFNFQYCPDQETTVQQRHEDHLDSVFVVFLLHHICGANSPLHPRWCPGSGQSPLLHPLLVPGEADPEDQDCLLMLISVFNQLYHLRRKE